MSDATQIAALLSDAVGHLIADESLPASAANKPPQVQAGRSPEHGHFSSPIALAMARLAQGLTPGQMAQLLLDRLEQPDWLERAEVAGPGYINFFLRADVAASVVLQALQQGGDYGRAPRTGEKVLVEFVSSNPTGPVHIGHGRGAAVGDVLASLCEAAGAEVAREYYVNDRGRQSQVLALSACLRFFSLPLAARAYQGEYIAQLAESEAELLQAHRPMAEPLGKILAAHRPDADAGKQAAAEEALLDQLLDTMQQTLGAEAVEGLCRRLQERVRQGIKRDLKYLGIEFDRWFSEASLYADPSQPVSEYVQQLLAKGDAQRRDDGAIWFLSTRYGDDKDRVVVRSNGEPTYFASDIAYHMDKFARGYDRLINVWGADHHGYEARLRGALQALGVPQEKLQILYVQFVALIRDGQRVGMSTRGASFVSLNELLSEVPADSVRLMYLSCAAVQSLDFDLQAAVAHNRDNPVYYIQYAHARICSLQSKAKKEKMTPIGEPDLALLATLTGAKEMQLQKAISRYPQLIAEAASQGEPHRLVVYLRDLAALFHSWYNAERMLCEDEQLRNARLGLCAALQQVFANGLGILGVKAPESM